MEGVAISNEILPFGSPFLGLFCLIPLYLALYRASGYREAFWIFLLQTLTVHLFSSYWLYNFHGYAVWSLGASAFGTALLGGLSGMVIFFLPGQLARNRGRTELEEGGGKRPYLIPARVLWFSAGFVFWEWIKSTGFLAYPWGTLFMTAYRWKIMTQIADITGVWGITFVFALFNATVAEGMRLAGHSVSCQNPPVPAICYRKTAKATAVIVCLTAAYGIFQYLVPRKVTKELNAIIVQQNVDPWEGGDAASIEVSTRLTEREADRMRDGGKEPDIVLWSEGVLNLPFPFGIDYYSGEPDGESLTDFIRRMDVPFLIGGCAYTDRVKRKVSNTAILFDRYGEYAGFYSKIHLVPFAEEVPFMDNPLVASFMRNVVGMPSTLTPGNQYVLFKIPLNSASSFTAPLRDGLAPYGTIALDSYGMRNPEEAEKYIENHDENPDSFVKFSTPICFEDAFPDVCTPLFNSGSEIFLNITNDSWSKTPSSEYQHFIVASFLAIEYRTTLVRCANAGYSVVVAPNGKILNDMAVFTEDALGCTVPVYERKQTVFSILGDWFAYMLFAFMGLYFIAECLVFHFDRIRKSPALLRFAEAVIKDREAHDEPERDVLTEEPAPAAPAASYIPEKAPLPEPSHYAQKDSTPDLTAEKTAVPKTVSAKTAMAEKSTAIKTATRKTATDKTASTKITATKKPAATKTAAKKTSTDKTSSTKNTAAKKPAATKTATRKTATDKTASTKNTAAKKTATDKTASTKNTAAKKTTATKPAAKKTSTDKTSSAKTTATKKSSATKPAAKKTATDKTSSTKKPGAGRQTGRGSK